MLALALLVAGIAPLAAQDFETFQVSVVDAQGDLLVDGWEVTCREWTEEGRSRRYAKYVDPASAAVEFAVRAGCELDVQARHPRTGFHVPWQKVPIATDGARSAVLHFQGIDPELSPTIEFVSPWTAAGFAIAHAKQIDVRDSTGRAALVQRARGAGGVGAVGGEKWNVALASRGPHRVQLGEFSAFEVVGEPEVRPGHPARIEVRGRAALRLTVRGPDGEPLDRFSVRAHSERIELSSDGGGFELRALHEASPSVYEGVPARGMTLRIDATGCATSYVTLEQLAPLETREVEVSLERAIDIRGALEFDGPTPENLVIAANDLEADPWTVRIGQGVAPNDRLVFIRAGMYAPVDEDGQFRIRNVPERPYRLDVRISRWVHLSAVVEPGDQVRLKAPDTGSLRGRVVLPFGMPPSSFAVRPRLECVRNVVMPIVRRRGSRSVVQLSPGPSALTPSSGIATLPSTDTWDGLLDREGWFGFSGLPEGPVELELVHRRNPNEYYDLGTFTVVGGESIEVEIDGSGRLPSPVSFLVAVDARTATQPMWVALGDDFKHASPSEEVFYGHLPFGEYTLEVRSDDGLWSSRHVVSLLDERPPLVTLNVVRSPGRLRVLDRVGEPLASGDVKLHHAGAAGGTHVVRLDGEGELALSLPEGLYVVSKVGSGDSRATFRWPPSGDVTTVRLSR